MYNLKSDVKVPVTEDGNATCVVIWVDYKLQGNNNCIQYYDETYGFDPSAKFSIKFFEKEVAVVAESQQLLAHVEFQNNLSDLYFKFELI